MLWWGTNFYTHYNQYLHTHLIYLVPITVSGWQQISLNLKHFFSVSPLFPVTTYFVQSQLLLELLWGMPRNEWLLFIFNETEIYTGRTIRWNTAKSYSLCTFSLVVIAVVQSGPEMWVVIQIVVATAGTPYSQTNFARIYWFLETFSKRLCMYECVYFLYMKEFNYGTLLSF